MAMAAILGLDGPAVEKACLEAAQGEVVSAANLNSPGQVVIAGHSAAVDRAIALCKAIDRYQPSAGASFKAYAVPTIVGELRRHFRDTGWALHIPRSLQDLSRQVGAGVNTLSTRLSRSPTIAEVAAYTGLTREQVIEGLEVRMAYDATSLDAGMGEEDEPGWLARLGADDANFETVEQHDMARRAGCAYGQGFLFGRPVAAADLPSQSAIQTH